MVARTPTGSRSGPRRGEAWNCYDSSALSYPLDPRSSPLLPILRLVLALGLAALVLGCDRELVRGTPASGGEPLVGADHATTYTWGWVDLSGRAEPRPDLGPTDSELALGSGWGPTEVWGRWALAPHAAISFSVEQSGAYDLLLEARAPHDATTPMSLRFGDQVPREFAPDRDWTLHRFSLDAPLPAGAYAVVLTRAEAVPSSAAGDDRALAVRRFGLVPVGTTFGPFASASVATPPPGVLHFERSASAIVPLAVPADATSVSVTVRTESNQRGSEPMVLDLSALTLDGDLRSLGRVEAPSTKRATDHLILDLQPFRGRALSLRLSARMPAAASGHFEVSDLRLHRGASSPAVATEVPSIPSTAPGPAPDIVLVILDAARADAFGLYGAERPTTPHLDALAETALVFEDATADCPYTLCSSPTLLTGVGLLRHGVVDVGLRLDDSIPTLAERLRDRGYHTIGVTANPNNSGRFGLSRGFDAYYDTWTQATSAQSWHPKRVHRFAERALAAAPDDQPLFLMVHYVPPHEPYAPGPAHDLFSDPAYEGVVTRDIRRQQAIFKHQFELDARDLGQLRALYDGNLRMADAWVARLFETLRQQGRFEDTVLVVTSDHGEAFLEHGEYGHNTTVYQEMVRIPLLLRPPLSWSPLPTRSRHLVSLVDVAPTILRLAGAEVGPTEGRDLFAPPDPDRVVFLRSSKAYGRVQWAARSQRYKAVVEPTRGALYDLTTDPGELENLATSRPALYHSLAARLRVALQGASRGLEDRTELSPEERQTLEALGYL